MKTYIPTADFTISKKKKKKKKNRPNETSKIDVFSVSTVYGLMVSRREIVGIKLEFGDSSKSS